MRRLGLFRYHNNLEICKNRLKLFRQINPDVKVYGLFGGKEEDFDDSHSQLKDYFEGNYCLKGKSNLWKWKNGDLAIRQWYLDYGKHLDFDMLHLLEWDLLMTCPIEEIYAHIPKDTLGVTGLISLEKVEEEWFWTRDPLQKENWNKLKDHVKKKYNFHGPYFASVGPGLMLTKSFLEQYAKDHIPEYCNDELRLPLFASALKLEMKDTGFLKKWFSKTEKKYFNCNENNISLKSLMKQLNKKNGRRVFHPFREEIDINLILNHKNVPCHDFKLL